MEKIIQFRRPIYGIAAFIVIIFGTICKIQNAYGILKIILPILSAVMLVFAVLEIKCFLKSEKSNIDIAAMLILAAVTVSMIIGCVVLFFTWR